MSILKRRNGRCIAIILRLSSIALLLVLVRDAMLDNVRIECGVLVPMRLWTSSRSAVPSSSRFEFPDGDDYTGLPRQLRKMAERGYAARLPTDGINRKIVVARADIMTIGREEWLADRLRLLPSAGTDVLCLDLSTEAMQFGETSEFMSAQLLGFHEAFASLAISRDRVVLLNANVASDYAHEAWRTDNRIDVRPRIIGFDFYFGEFQLDLKSFYSQQALFGQVLDRSHRTVSGGVRRARHFTCLNHRPRTHRYAVVLFLLSRGHLDKGFVSFAGEQDGRVDAPTVAPLEETRRFLMRLPEGAEMVAGLDGLLARGPLVLDRSADEIREKLWGKDVGEIAQSLGMVHGSGLGIFDSYFEIVTETWFADERCQYLTEKALRPLASLRPFLLVGPPFSLHRLRSYGFKTFEPFISENYDIVSDPVERMTMVFKEVDRLCRLDRGELHGLYCKLWPILVHNYMFLWNDGLKTFREGPLQTMLSRL
jgi:hypothetical protein